MEINPAPEPGRALPPSGPTFFRRRGGWAIAGVIVAAVAGITLARRNAPQPTAGTPQDEVEELADTVSRDAGYLGAQACTACHARRVTGFQGTSHFRACRVPHDGEMPAGFDPGKGGHRTHDPALRFDMTRVGGEYFQTAIQTTPAGAIRSRARIDLVYGAARADEVFFSWRDDRLYELMMVWLHPQNRWANASFNHKGGGGYGRDATPRCIECHNTWFDHQPGTANGYNPDGIILGVTCERCHGPGRDHVAFHRSHPGSAAGHAVVRPGQLSRERQIEVCTQCHSNTPKGRGPAFSYRPGEPLERYYRTSKSKYPENDHVANQIQYLRRSKCFQQSDAMTCTTCHDPHRPNNPVTVQKACGKCHTAGQCTEQPRLPAAVRDNCVGCHMPAQGWMNVHFHTEDDRYVPVVRRHQHKIGLHPQARQEVLLAWHRTRTDPHGRQEAGRLQSELVKYWVDEAKMRQVDYRFLAAIGALREAYRLDPTPATAALLRRVIKTQADVDGKLIDALDEIKRKQFPQAIETLKATLALKPDLAVAHGKLGMAYAVAGQKGAAIEHLRAVGKYDPDDPYGFMMLGWLAYLEGRAEEALEDYRRADEIEPFDSKIHYHWGLALLKLSRWAEASQQFEQVRIIDPNHAGACQGLAHSLRQMGRPAKALPLARRAAKLTAHQNLDVLATLAEVELDAGRFRDAEQTADRALGAADARNNLRESEIRHRLEKIRLQARQALKKEE